MHDSFDHSLGRAHDGGLRIDLEERQLDPRCRHAVVVVVAGEAVLGHLLQNDHEGGNQVLGKRK